MQTRVDVEKTYTLSLDDDDMATLRRIADLAKDQIDILPESMRDPVIMTMITNIKELK